jgi:hypothetical protein
MHFLRLLKDRAVMGITIRPDRRRYGLVASSYRQSITHLIAQHAFATVVRALNQPEKQ